MPYQRKRTLQELNLSDDFLFSKVFSDAEVCRQVLQKILKVKIKKIKFVENQKSIDLLMESKAIRLDIYVQDEKETIYCLPKEDSHGSIFDCFKVRETFVLGPAA